MHLFAIHVCMRLLTRMSVSLSIGSLVQLGNVAIEGLIDDPKSCNRGALRGNLTGRS